MLCARPHGSLLQGLKMAWSNFFTKGRKPSSSDCVHKFVPDIHLKREAALWNSVLIGKIEAGIFQVQASHRLQRRHHRFTCGQPRGESPRPLWPVRLPPICSREAAIRSSGVSLQHLALVSHIAYGFSIRCCTPCLSSAGRAGVTALAVIVPFGGSVERSVRGRL